MKQVRSVDRIEAHERYAHETEHDYGLEILVRRDVDVGK
jgi:hypothetical protein